MVLIAVWIHGCSSGVVRQELGGKTGWQELGGKNWVARPLWKNGCCLAEAGSFSAGGQQLLKTFSKMLTKITGAKT
jgi:hypothetical protein